MGFTTYLEYLKEAKQKLISKHYSMYDTCNSATAKAEGIDNTIPVELTPNAILVTAKILEPLCIYFKTRPDVSCMFRCPALNKIVGGVAGSQHVKAQAVDFVIVGVSLIDIVNYVRNNLEFDQIILEESGGKKWIHVSYSSMTNRRECLKYLNGKYISF